MKNPNPPEKVRFVADQMLGRLSKWLRLLGFDTLYLNPTSDTRLIEVAKNDGRVLLTRDTLLMERRLIKRGEVKAVLVCSDLWEEQLTQVVDELGISWYQSSEATFCRECNGRIQRISKDEVKEKVPLYVYQTQDEFSWCPNCGRFYWEGGHWEKITEKLKSIFGGTSGFTSKK